MENPPVSPNIAKAALFGLLTGGLVALVYGVLADPFGLSWGLIIVGLVGGALIGAAAVRGAFSGRFHLIVPRVRWLAAILGVIAWLEGTIVAYISSQFFYQAATSPLVDRLSIAGFFDYLSSSVLSPSILGLAAMAFMAWRAAR